MHDRHIWIVTGPAGCGKTTVAQDLARYLQLPFLEGDDFHSASNQAKMAAGQPLSDQDRWDWLISLREAALHQVRPSHGHAGVVVTCSALKHRYRDVIRIAAYNDDHVKVHFIFLRADEVTLVDRVAHRHGHYMKSGMVHSQVDVLEEPDARERDVLEVDCRGSVAQVQQAVRRAVQSV